MIKNFFTKRKIKNWKYCKHCGKELEHEEVSRLYDMKTGRLIEIDYLAACPSYNNLLPETFPHDYYEYSLEV